MADPVKPGWRARAILIIIALSAVIPFGLAWYYSKHPELIDKTSNYGTLIIPARQLDMNQVLGQPVSTPAGAKDAHGRWILLQIVSASCEQACTETLHKTHQGWLMLNKEMPRVNRVLLVTPNAKVEESEPVKADDALVVSKVNLAILQTVTDALGKAPEAGSVILVDPLGNLVLWYAPGFDPYLMVKDLKHLLKASQIG